MLRLSVYSDVICPWCLVGKRRLERALRESGLDSEAAIEWLPFELNPDMPPGGMPRSAYRARKFGEKRAADLDRAMTETGAQEGITFAFDRMAATPSTRAAHVLIAEAGPTGRQGALVEALFRAYFEEGRDIGDREVLLTLAGEAGLARAEADRALDDPSRNAAVEALERKGLSLGIQGVPFFVVDGRWAVSGAQPSEQWIELLASRGQADARRETSRA